jgi:hypothetical protein
VAVLPQRADRSGHGFVAADGQQEEQRRRADESPDQRERGLVELVGIVDRDYERAPGGPGPEVVRRGQQQAEGVAAAGAGWRQVRDGPEGDRCRGRGAVDLLGRRALGPRRSESLGHEPAAADALDAADHHGRGVAAARPADVRELLVAADQGPVAPRDRPLAWAHAVNHAVARY